MNTHPLLNYETNIQFKFPLQHSYYTHGSFKNPKQHRDGYWIRDKVGYGIYNPRKDEIQISKRLPSLQTIFRA